MMYPFDAPFWEKLFFVSLASGMAVFAYYFIEAVQDVCKSAKKIREVISNNYAIQRQEHRKIIREIREKWFKMKAIGIMIVCMMITSVIITVASNDDTAAAAAAAAATPSEMLEWFVGGYWSNSWIQVNVDSETSFQTMFLTLTSGEGISGYTKDNTSVTASAIDNVNENLAYFNWSLLSSGETADIVMQFERYIDVFGNSQINITGYYDTCTDADITFNCTMGIINIYDDSGLDSEWWLEIVDNATVKPYYWRSGDSNIEAYNAFKTEDDRLLIMNTNSANLYGHVQTQLKASAALCGYWFTLMANTVYAQNFDVDGRLIGTIKMIDSEPKQRYGNVLTLLPWSSQSDLYDMSVNESIFSNAQNAGITHIYLETFLIQDGTYEPDNQNVSDSIDRIKSLTHSYEMKLVIPSYFKAFTSAGESPLLTYSIENEALIFSAWENYLIQFENITDEYSIGYADIGPINYGDGYAIWNQVLIEKCLKAIRIEKPITLWSHQMYYTDDSIGYLNTEWFANAHYDKIDAYFDAFPSRDIEPAYDMAGQKTWTFSMKVTKADDEAEPFTLANTTFETRLIQNSYSHGHGISIIYHESLYSNGFSLSMAFVIGLTEDMTFTLESNWIQYEDSNSIAIVYYILESFDVSANSGKTYPCYFTALSYDLNVETITTSISIGDNEHSLSGSSFVRYTLTETDHTLTIILTILAIAMLLAFTTILFYKERDNPLTVRNMIIYVVSVALMIVLGIVCFITAIG